MARKSKRSREVYRAPRPKPEPQPNQPFGGPVPRRAGRRSSRGGSVFPFLPVSLAGLGIGLLVIAGLAFANAAPSRTELATPAALYPAEKDDGSLGAVNAPVTVEEWADFQCPACGLFARTVEPFLIDTYVEMGKVRLVFLHLAFLGQESVEAATAAECAGEQARFWPYHGYLYANQAGENRGAFSAARLGEIAQAVGLDTLSFDACMSGRAARSRVLTETSAARQAGIDHTPTFHMGSQVVVGVPSWDQLSAVIEAELEAAAGS